MSLEVGLTCSLGFPLVAVWEEKRLVDLVCWDETCVAGNVYVGVVARVDRDLDAAFVDLGEARLGFLPLGGRSWREGQRLVVHVEREPRGAKGPKLAPGILVEGRYALLRSEGATSGEPVVDPWARREVVERLRALVPQPLRVRVRAQSTGVSLEALEHDVATLVSQAQTMGEKAQAARAPCLLARSTAASLLREIMGRPVGSLVVEGDELFEEVRDEVRTWAPDLEPRLRRSQDALPLLLVWGRPEEIEGILSPRVDLPSGVRLTIQETEAFVAVDVDSGPAPRSRGHEGALQANLEAAGELAHQMRVRNLGGSVVVDFIAMGSRRAAQDLLEHLRRSLRDDPRPSAVWAVGRMGLVHVVRKRRGKGLADKALRSCPTCGRLGGSLDPAFAARWLDCRVRAMRARGEPPPRGLEVSPEVDAHLHHMAAPWPRVVSSTPDVLRRGFRIGGVEATVRTDLPGLDRAGAGGENACSRTDG